MRKIPIPIPNNCTGSGPAPKRPGHLLQEQPGESGRNTPIIPRSRGPMSTPTPISPDPEAPNPNNSSTNPDDPRPIPPHGARSGI